MRGMFKNNKLGVDEFLSEKKEELELEEVIIKRSNKQ